MWEYDWVQNPFQFKPDAMDLPATETEQLIEISCDQTYAQLSLP